MKITTCSKTIQRLKKGIDEANKEKASCLEEKEKSAFDFKEIEKKALLVEEKYNNLKEVPLIIY